MDIRFAPVRRLVETSYEKKHWRSKRLFMFFKCDEKHRQNVQLGQCSDQ